MNLNHNMDSYVRTAEHHNTINFHGIFFYKIDVISSFKSTK